jgi:hypothetical protein
VDQKGERSSIHRIFPEASDARLNAPSDSNGFRSGRSS